MMDYNNGPNYPRRSPGDSIMMFLATIGVLSLVSGGILIGLFVSPILFP